MVATDLYYLADYLLMLHLKVKVFNLIGRIWRELIFALQGAKLGRMKLEVKEKTNLESEKLVAYVFSDDKPFELIRRQMCWGFAVLNDIECGEDYFLKVDTIMHNANLYPQFGLGHLKAIRLTRGLSPTCARCGKKYPEIYHPQWLRVWSHKDEAIPRTRCSCGFRGLCSSTCLSEKPEECQRASYCKECRRNRVQSCEVDFHRDGDGLIQHKEDCECDGDDDDTDYVPSNKSDHESVDDD